MTTRKWVRCGATLLLIGWLVAPACSVNPATGKRQLVLIGEGQELAIGRENDQQISAQMGLYDDDALQQYVHALGRRMAATSERPDLEWTFRVVDDQVVNAFALPGGYIYITRGILAHFENEAELASVVGHEIGHVTARHGVSQMSKAQLAQIGLGLGSILAPQRAESFGGLATNLTGLLFLKFGRDDERQADDLGLRYLSRLRYDVRPMADVFDMLAAVSAAGGGGRVPAWVSTHPAPENRRERIAGQVAAMNQDFASRPVGREEYLKRIDGITFGVDPQQGYFRDNLFLHPLMRFRIEFPSGWQTVNQREAVVGQSSAKDAVIRLSLASQDSAETALAAFFSEPGITRTGPAMGSVNGLPTAGGGFSATTGEGTVVGRIGFVEYGDNVFALLGYASESRWPDYEPAVRRTLSSFDRMTDPAVLQARPKRLQVVTPSRSMSLDEFARQYAATVPVATLALINRLSTESRLEAGRSYKVVTGGSEP